MINAVVLVGRVATEPQTNFTNKTNIPVSNFRIAVDKQMSQEQKEAAKKAGEPTADFLDIVAWRQQAEYVGSYVTKGRLIAIEGRLATREFIDKDNQRRRVVEIVADNIKGLDKAPQTQE